jgi:spoIIIJ-associated protein
MSYIDVSGKTEDEALSKALAQLGLDRDDVSVQILERAKSGFLGLGSQPAVVRVTYGQDEFSMDAVVRPAVKPEKKPELPVRPAETRTPRAEASRTEAPRAEAPRVRQAAPVQRAPRIERTPRPRPEERPVSAVPLGEEVDDEKAQAIKAFLGGLLEKLETPAQVRVYLPEKGRYKVLLEGAGLGALIGRRGETLDAIQQLTSYSVNRAGGRVRVQLDAENYRERREQSLAHLAQKVAAKVSRYRRSVTLEPMNAYERHVIHTALQDTPGITTYSTGVEPNRRVVVALDRERAD